jgi:hypothetical protein
VGILIKNWDLKDAKVYFNAICDHDAARFSERLRDEIIDDIAVNNKVRPIEMQIVAKYCVDCDINDIEDYKMVGGYEGIQPHFITQTLKGFISANDELSSEIGVFMLRTLYSALFNTKRIEVGVSPTELEMELENAVATNKIKDRRPGYKTIFPDMLNFLMESKLIVRDNKGNFKLYHDYLANGIAAIPRGKEPLDLRATEIVHQYLKWKVDGHKTLMPIRQFFIVLRHLPSEEKSKEPVRKLLGSEKRSYIRYGSFLSIILATLVIYFFPPQVVYSKAEPIPLEEYLLHYPDITGEWPNYLRTNDSLLSVKIFRTNGLDSCYLYYYNSNKEIAEVVKNDQEVSVPVGKMIFDRGALFIVDSSRRRVFLYRIMGGQLVFNGQAALPEFTSDSSQLNQISYLHNTYHPYYSYIDAVQRYFVDGPTGTFLAETDSGISYSTNLSGGKMNTFRFVGPIVTKEDIPNVFWVGDHLLVMCNGGIFDLARDGEMMAADPAINYLFYRFRLQYSEDMSYLYYLDTAENRIHIYHAFIPKKMEELSDSIASITPPRVAINEYPRCIKVQRCDTLTYAVSSYYDTYEVNYFSHGWATYQLPYPGERTDSIFSFTTGPLDGTVVFNSTNFPRAISWFKKTNYQRTDTVCTSFDIKSVHPETQDKLTFIYLTPAHYLKWATLDELNRKVKDGNMFLDLNQAGFQNAYWSKNNKYIYYNDGRSIYFGSKRVMLKQAVTFDANFSGFDVIKHFYAAKGGLFIHVLRDNNNEYYVVKRRLRFLGVNVFSPEWPATGVCGKIEAN